MSVTFGYISILLAICAFVCSAHALQNCTFSPTACACSASVVSGNCSKLVDATDKGNICEDRECAATFKCDCSSPSHICSLATCDSWQPEGRYGPGVGTYMCSRETRECVAPMAEIQSVSPDYIVPNQTDEDLPTSAKVEKATTLQNDSLSVSKQSSTKCSPAPESSRTTAATTTASEESVPDSLSQVIEQVALVAVSEHVAPSATGRRECETSHDCATNEFCVDFTCTKVGECNSALEGYCAALDPLLQCCSKRSSCMLGMAGARHSICSTDCSSRCKHSGALLCTLGQESSAVRGMAIRPCPAVLRGGGGRLVTIFGRR